MHAVICYRKCSTTAYPSGVLMDTACNKRVDDAHSSSSEAFRQMIASVAEVKSFDECCRLVKEGDYLPTRATPK